MTQKFMTADSQMGVSVDLKKTRERERKTRKWWRVFRLPGTRLPMGHT